MNRFSAKILLPVGRVLTCLFLALFFGAFSSCAESLTFPMAVLSEFSGKRIGLTAGTSQEALTEEIFDDPQISYFSSYPDIMLALRNGKIDAYFGDDLLLHYSASQTGEFKVLRVGDDEIGAAPIFQKNEEGEKLRTEYNEFLRTYKESGKLDALISKWFEGTEEERVLDTRELPDTNGTLTIATEVGNIPFEYVKNNEIIGLDIELVRDFCREYGYRPEFVNTSFDSIIMGVYAGKFDIAAADLTVTEERAQSVNFGDAYLTLHNGLLVLTGSGFTGAGGNADAPGVTTGEDTEKDGFFGTFSEGIRRTFLEEERWKLFASGIGVTLLITVLSALLGTAGGFLLYLLCRNGNRAVNKLTDAARWLITGMPLVVFLMVLFYVVFAKSNLSGTAVAVIGFTVIFSFTMFGLLRSGENAVDIGQKEAAYSLGYGNMDTFFRIILPQAAMHFLPSYLGEVDSLLKATAVVGYITVMDVTKMGDIVRGRTYDAIFPLLAVVIAYFLMSALCKALVRMAMRKVDTRKRPKSEIMKGVVIR